MIKIRDDIVIQDPQTRIREYCEIEIYHGYDDKHAINNSVSKEDIDAANNLYAMIDRYDQTESTRLLKRSEPISALLRTIPTMEIHKISDEEWLTVLENVSKVLAEFLSLKGFGLAKATKILHLKRPKLFPVLDSFVVKFLLDVDLSAIGKTHQVNIGVQAVGKARKIVADQEKEFRKVAEDLSDLSIPLTLIRIFDILCWTTEKWDIRGIHTAPYGTPLKSLLRLSTTKQSAGHSIVKAPKSDEYVVYEDLIKAAGPKVHHVSCLYYKRWLDHPTSTTTWHGPYPTEKKAWKICKAIAARDGSNRSKHRCVA